MDGGEEMHGVAFDPDRVVVVDGQLVGDVEDESAVALLLGHGLPVSSGRRSRPRIAAALSSKSSMCWWEERFAAVPWWTLLWSV